MKELISRMRDDNDANISKIQDLNEDEIEKLREKLQEQYLWEAWKIHEGIPDIDSTEVVEQRQNLEDVRSKLSNCEDSVERQRLKDMEQKLMK